ncbi:MAG: hypothetical protein MUO59_01345 [Actinobacteria bacterium]|nr:hypothetical protein [Actinomycetota bacterium]
MAKKIILGLIITAFISLTSFGALYAYQEENPGLEKDSAKEYGIYYSINGNQAGEFSELTDGDDELESPKYERQIRNNFRYREEKCDDCSQAAASRNEYQHRYENEYNKDCENKCEGNEKSVQNQNRNSNKQNKGGE